MTQAKRRRRKFAARRRGAILILVLTALGLATIMVGLAAQSAIARHRQLRRRGEALQARWLVESGVERAAARLATGAEYDGETWTVSPEALAGPHGGEVTIRVRPDETEARRRIVDVVARYPAADPQGPRQSKQLTIDLSRLRGSS